MLSAKKRAALGDVSNRCFGRPAADALASFYKDADTSSLLLAPDIHLLILEHVGAPAYVVTAGVSKSWREAVLIKLRALCIRQMRLAVRHPLLLWLNLGLTALFSSVCAVVLYQLKLLIAC